MGHFSLSGKNWHLPQCCHLSWLEKSDVRHISHQRGPPTSPPQPADWACSHLHRVIWSSTRGPSAAQSSYGFKALHCLLNHNTNCPASGLNKRFFFLLFSVGESPPCAYDVSMRLTALDQVGQPVSVGITHQSGKQR